MSNKIISVARKEFLDIFRDKRTILRMMIIPALIMPLILFGITKIQSAQSEKEATKELKVGVIDNGNGEELLSYIEADSLFTLSTYADTNALNNAILEEEINMGIHILPGFSEAVSGFESGMIMVHFRGTEESEFDRLSDLIDSFEKGKLNDRIARKELTGAFLEPVEIIPINLSTTKELIGKYAGGILPYFFIAFCFMGCMYPAIDLFTGEKERGTLETILTTPVSRAQIMIGKMIVVVAFGLLSASLAIGGLLVGINVIELPDMLKSVILDIISPQLILTLATILFPLAIFFAGVLIPICVYAKSFKEAQSIATPLNIMIVLPAMVGFLPGIELNAITAFIPIANIVLATKDIIAGTIDYGYLIIAYASLILLAVGAVILSLKQFSKESNILRGE